MRVFIENEAGSRTKHHHDEKALRFLGTEEVSRPYPFPYGFVIGTTGGDGDNVDCFVITSDVLHTGEIVDCIPIGLLEQVEDGNLDHNVLAVPVGEPQILPAGAEEEIRAMIVGFREHQPDVESIAGRLLDRAAAEAYVEACRDG
jgi:inorganic pyrophosphatase